MNTVSLFRSGRYSTDWIKDFYTQAGIWWGAEPHDDPGDHRARVAIVERLRGPGKWGVLDLGTGSGFTAAALADAGHAAVGVELNPTDIAYAQELLAIPRPGSLSIVEGDYYTVELDGRFDVVCWWQGFGLGSDADQRRMLRRIAHEWLAPGGCALIDVYNPTWAARRAGEAVHLDALKGVPGSVDMIERSHFDPVYGRWIDEWQPAADPDKALAQTVRCYAPADLLLLLEGTGLALQRIELDGQEVDFSSNQIALSAAMLEAWAYLAQLVPAGGAARAQSVSFNIEGPYLGKAAVCEPILRALPAWFGIEEAIVYYVAEIEHLPTFLASDSDGVVAFASLKRHYPSSAEVYVIAVRQEVHRQGVGRALIERAKEYLKAQGVEYLQVKTLGPSHGDAGYAKTRAFYAAVGFRPLEEFAELWDERNPCLIMVQRL